MGIQFLTELVQAAILGMGVVVFILVKLAPRHPRLAWLQAFRLVDRRTEEQKRRTRRNANIMAGLQLILIGIALVPGYFILSMMMFFSDVSDLEIAAVGTVSLLVIGAGITAIVRSGSA